MNIRYDINGVSKEELFAYFKVVNNDFPVPLDTIVNLEDYVAKIISNAIIFNARIDSILVGVIAVYFNNMELKLGYITSVSCCWKRLGISSCLLEMAKDYGRINGFEIVRTQVDKENIASIRLHQKKGFHFIGDLSQNNFYMDCIL